MTGLSESQVRLALEGLIKDSLTGHRASLPDTPYVFAIEPSAAAGMCVVVRDPETNVEHLRCIVKVSARKIPSPHQPTFGVCDTCEFLPATWRARERGWCDHCPRPATSVMVTPAEDVPVIPGTASNCDAPGCTSLFTRVDAGRQWCALHACPPVIPWRTGAWTPMKIRGGLDYRYAPVAGDIVLAPDGSGERYVVIEAITKANPANVTVRSVIDPDRQFTFPVDPDVPSPVKFVRAGEVRGLAILAEALPRLFLGWR